MILVVTGGRDYTDNDAVIAALDPYTTRPERLQAIMHGACRTGLDDLVSRYCSRRCIPQDKYHAEWHHHGKRAGPLRNSRMINAACAWVERGVEVVVLSFPGGRGTQDCTDKAHRANLPVYYIRTSSDL